MEDKLKILYKKVGQEPVVMDIENTLEAKQKLVGGLIEVVPFNDLIIICNEEGKLLNELPNISIGYDYICGDFFIVGDDYDNADFKSLTDEQIEKCKKDLKEISFNYEKENHKDNTQTKPKQRKFER